MQEIPTPVHLHKSTNSIMACCLNAALGGIYFGYTGGVYNILQLNMHLLYRLKDDDAYWYDSVLTALWPLGALLGALYSSTLSLYGRRQALIITDLIGLIGCVLSAIHGMSLLMISRTIIGFAAGLNSSLVPLYINEISPRSISGLTGSLTQLVISFGFFICVFFGVFLPTKEVLEPIIDTDITWKYVSAFPIVPCFLRSILLLRYYTFETPIFLLMSEEEKQAEALVARFYKPEHVKPVLDKYVEELNNTPEDIEIKELFVDRRYRRRMIIGIMLGFLQQWGGINGVNFFSTDIFLKTLNNEFWARLCTSFLGLMLIISTLIGGRIVDNVGRKSVFLIGEIMLVFSLFFLVQHMEKSPGSVIFFIFLFEFSWGFSLGPVFYIYVSETLPEKGIAMSCVSMWVNAFLVGISFPIIEHSFRIKGPFVIYLVVCVIGALFIEFYLLETKGKTPKEIDELFEEAENNNKSRRKKKQLLSDYREIQLREY